MRKLILGIDPGKTGAYCFLEAGKPLSWGKVDTHNYKSIIEMYNTNIISGDEVIVYIEDAYLHVKKLNPKVLIQHARSIGFLCGIFTCIDLTTYLVQPNKWQSEMLYMNGIKGKDTKESSKLLSKYYGVTTKNHNIADAVCLAMYGYNQERLKDAVQA